MEPWIIRSRVRHNSLLRLICFPFPGASATLFERWHEYLPETVEVCAVQLPGRQKRITEAPIRDVETAVDLLAAFLLPHLDRPLAIFGDCAAAFLAFELCHRLKNTPSVRPVHLFVTSCRAPHLPNSREVIHRLPDLELKREMVKLGVVPQWLQQNDAVFSAFLNLIRADFEMVETYQMRKPGDFEFPVTAIAGSSDPTCTVEELAAWERHTKVGFRKVLLDASHNITESHLEEIIAVLKEDLQSVVRTT